MAFVLAPFRDGRRLMNAAIPIDGTEILIKDLWQLTLSCCRDDTMPEYRRSLFKFTNIPRQMRFRCHDNDTMSLTLDGHRCKDNKENQPASFYRNGGRKENKIPPEEKFTVQEGTILTFRPPLQYRNEQWMRNLEYRVVAADADAADVVEEEEAEVVVDADTADDVVVEEVVEEEEIEELTVKSEGMLIQERHDRAEESGLVVSLLDTPDKIKEPRTTTKTTVVVDEEEEAEAVPLAIAVVDEVVPLPRLSPLAVRDQKRSGMRYRTSFGRSEVTQKDESIIVVPSTSSSGTSTSVIDVPSFEEIQRAMGFSPLNDTNNSIPHDEDLMGWHSPEAPRPSRRSIYDPLQIN